MTQTFTITLSNDKDAENSYQYNHFGSFWLMSTLLIFAQRSKNVRKYNENSLKITKYMLNARKFVNSNLKKSRKFLTDNVFDIKTNTVIF